MQTLIKYPGGKTKEFRYIQDLIPDFERYVEPFFGGGGIFFQLEPKKAIINDICSELINFYFLLKDEKRRIEFKKELYDYVINWEKIPKYIGIFEDKLIVLYQQFKNDKISKEKLKENINKILIKEKKCFNEFFLKDFCLNEQNLLK